VPVKRTRLAARRKVVGFSQEMLAERLQVDRSTVVRWESGESDPQPWKRTEMAQALRVSVEQLDELLTGESMATADPDEERAGSSSEIANHNEAHEARPALHFTSPVDNSELGSITRIFSSLDEEENTEDPADVLKRVQTMRRSMIHPDVMKYLQDSTRRTITHYESLDHSVLFPALRKQQGCGQSHLRCSGAFR